MGAGDAVVSTDWLALVSLWDVPTSHMREWFGRSKNCFEVTIENNMLVISFVVTFIRKQFSEWNSYFVSQC
jgi:hypothetical protein